MQYTIPFIRVRPIIYLGAMLKLELFSVFSLFTVQAARHSRRIFAYTLQLDMCSVCVCVCVRVFAEYADFFRCRPPLFFNPACIFHSVLMPSMMPFYSILYGTFVIAFIGFCPHSVACAVLPKFPVLFAILSLSLISSAPYIAVHCIQLQRKQRERERPKTFAIRYITIRYQIKRLWFACMPKFPATQRANKRIKQQLYATLWQWILDWRVCDFHDPDRLLMFRTLTNRAQNFILGHTMIAHLKAAPLRRWLCRFGVASLMPRWHIKCATCDMPLFCDWSTFTQTHVEAVTFMLWSRWRRACEFGMQKCCSRPWWFAVGNGTKCIHRPAPRRRQMTVYCDNEHMVIIHGATVPLHTYCFQLDFWVLSWALHTVQAKVFCRHLRMYSLSEWQSALLQCTSVSMHRPTFRTESASNESSRTQKAEFVELCVENVIRTESPAAELIFPISVLPIEIG